MNIENARKLVSQLERLPDEKFDMGTWIEHGRPACGTTACLAGWCALLNSGPKDNTLECEVFARDWLNLNISQAHHLFYGEFIEDDNRHWATTTRLEAIAELNRMIGGRCS